MYIYTTHREYAGNEKGMHSQNWKSLFTFFLRGDVSRSRRNDGWVRHTSKSQIRVGKNVEQINHVGRVNKNDMGAMPFANPLETKKARWHKFLVC